MFPEEATLRPQPRLDIKWLNTDLEVLFSSQECLNNSWNGLIADGELIGNFSVGLLNSAGVTAKQGEFGKYYCGQRVLTCTCCDGICGPVSGCNCQPCQKLDVEESQKNVFGKDTLPSMHSLLEQWAWAPELGPDELSQSLSVLNLEQKTLCSLAADSTLSATRLYYCLSILKRYFVALNRTPHAVDAQQGFTHKKMNIDCNEMGKNVPKIDPKVQTLDPTAGLARVGSKAALNFAFAFLKRAWRLGEDTDLCSELLTESLDALRILPVATLFDEEKVSSVWLEVVERSSKFLLQVVTGNVTSGRQFCSIPIEDQHTSLNLLLELALQKGNLSSILNMVLLLLSLWDNRTHTSDNRSNYEYFNPMAMFRRTFNSLNKEIDILKLSKYTFKKAIKDSVIDLI